MDINTVIEIISLLEIDINHHWEEAEKKDENYEGRIGAHWALSEFRDYLQKAVDGQLNALENQTPEQ